MKKWGIVAAILLLAFGLGVFALRPKTIPSLATLPINGDITLELVTILHNGRPSYNLEGPKIGMFKVLPKLGNVC